MQITKEEFVEWKANPVTIAVFEEVRMAKDSLLQTIAEGLTLSQNADITQGLTSKTIGQIEGLNQLLNISYEDAEKEYEDDNLEPVEED